MADRSRFWLTLITLLWLALSLGPSFAHVLEAWPRLTVWSPQLWRETTVFNQQFLLFAIVGAPLDLGAIVIAAVFAFSLRGDRPAVRFALAATVLYAASLACWFAIVAPANSLMGTWTPCAEPAGFASVRLRWEAGHMIVAAIKFLGFAMAVAATLAAGRKTQSHAAG